MRMAQCIFVLRTCVVSVGGASTDAGCPGSVIRSVKVPKRHPPATPDNRVPINLHRQLRNQAERCFI